jgi:hypothetical protein
LILTCAWPTAYDQVIDDLTTKKLVIFVAAAVLVTFLIAAVPLAAEAFLH